MLSSSEVAALTPSVALVFVFDVSWLTDADWRFPLSSSALSLTCSLPYMHRKSCLIPPRYYSTAFLFRRVLFFHISPPTRPVVGVSQSLLRCAVSTPRDGSS